MKNNKKLNLLLLSILFLILVFIYCWEASELLNLLFIGLSITNILLIILFLILSSYIFKELKNNKCLINIISFSILILTILLVLFFPFREVKFKLEFELYKVKREEIIRLLQNNKLNIDEVGQCILPNKLDMVSEDGKIMVYKNDVDGILVGFWYFRGIGTNSELLMYSSLGESLIESNLGNKIINVEMLSDNWYYVVIE